MILPVAYKRDPLSLTFDPVTRRALGRCYANPGRWVPVRLPRITPRLFVAWFARGVDLGEPDRWDDSITRYVRGFVRSAYWQHYWHGGFDGIREQQRTAPWHGLVLVYRARQTTGQWRISLMAAPKGDPRLPARGRGFISPERAGVGGK
jgi:hypothetical protein